MRTVRFAWVGLIATAAIALGGRQASAQYYGYPSAQSSLPAGQGGYVDACHGCVPPPPPPCQPDKCGCIVIYCPPVGDSVSNPPYEPPPGCQAAWVITDECAPSKTPIWVTVTRNHYVPIRVQKVPSAYDVQPVNFQVKQRIVHFLCDCAPGTPQCPHIPSGASHQSAAAETGSAPAMAQVAPSGPAPAAAPAVATAPEGDGAPSKRWVWLKNVSRYGYGYRRSDGLWQVDPNSLRQTLPAASTAAIAGSNAGIGS